jgi:hypothetical protein
MVKSVDLLKGMNTERIQSIRVLSAMILGSRAVVDTATPVESVLPQAWLNL